MLNRLKIIEKFKLKGDKFLKKMPNNVFFLGTPLKMAKNMPSYDVYAKQHFLMPNLFLKGQISVIWH